jgi:phage baseplate assembly protein W
VSPFTFTLPGFGGSSSLPAADRTSQVDRMFGVDLWLDVSTEAADLLITPAKDWQIVRGREALRQSLLRRLITNPGEWATLPQYGVGARLFVKERNTKAKRDELANRIRDQFLRDPRVASVDQIVIESLPEDFGIKLAVYVTPKGRLEAGGSLAVQITIAR